MACLVVLHAARSTSPVYSRYAKTTAVPSSRIGYREAKPAQLPSLVAVVSGKTLLYEGCRQARRICETLNPDYVRHEAAHSSDSLHRSAQPRLLRQ